MSQGKNITSADNSKAFLAANDEIRGVITTCYGDCPSGNCEEPPIHSHEIIWYPPSTCVDGGVIRPNNTYTNLSTSGFKTPIGYSGHFYGIRKYTDLIPNAPYSIVIEGKTGLNQAIQLPTEFIETEYGINDYVGYSGNKLVEPVRASENRYGKSVSVKDNVLAVGAPFETLVYSETEDNITTTYNLNEAGCVYLYRREDRPSGTWPVDKDKSPWVLESKITLPSGYLKDYYTAKQKTIPGLPLPIEEKYWSVAQEGRQFGHSLALAVNSGYKSFQEDRREILVVGAPSSKWTPRNFEELSTSGVQIGLMLFTDEFIPVIFGPKLMSSDDDLDYRNVLSAISDKDLIFQYFSDPPIKFEPKLIICEPLADNTNRPIIDFPAPQPEFITKKRISRNQGIVNEEQTQVVLSGMIDAFHTAFPYDTNKIHNNIPPMLGVIVDNSRSLGERALQPALDRFIQYYRNYSFASGLRDFYGVRSSGIVYNFQSLSSAQANSRVEVENWVLGSINAFNVLLDTGRLVRDDQVRFLTSGIGQEFFNENLSGFNHFPESGGRVYIFEKESGAWNFVQEIKTADMYGIPNRFGHSVSISDNTEVIAVGSPYISDSCKIYEYKPERKRAFFNSLPSWLSYKSSVTGGIGKYADMLIDLFGWVAQYGQEYGNQILYSKLTPEEKFEARKYLNINEYENIYNYGYNSIPYKGEKGVLIPTLFAPTSRLGYSTAVNQDGSIVAFGAPTDSFNAWDDLNVWYDNEGYEDTLYPNYNGGIIGSWKANTNAGAVRLLEARKAYPHSGIVEFTKFGNLEKSLSRPNDSGRFEYLGNYYRTQFPNRYFRRTEFTDVKIPEDAGLAFIITPQIDALSDEVTQNIIDWLSLGDRNLVLVGNDPVWEASGAYRPSNEILNKILDRLNSKLRLYPARSQEDALSSECGKLVSSYQPYGISTSHISARSMKASGVADIRMYFKDNFNFLINPPCPGSEIKDNFLGTSIIDPNTKCNLPIKHGGDLRAEFRSSCINKITAEPWEYWVNWPFVFKTYDPDFCAEPPQFPRFDLPGMEPIPLLVAAREYIETINIPAQPVVSGQIPIFRTVTIPIQSKYFNENPSDSATFVIDSGYNPNIISPNLSSNPNDGLFYQPSVFSDRQAILQANATSYTEVTTGSEKVSDQIHYALLENFDNSQLICIAGTDLETERSLYTGAGDRNINFFVNMVSKNIRGESRIAQLGGWTGRETFTAANPASILKDVFLNTGNDVTENVTNLSSIYDVCWIACPAGLPSSEELSSLKQWLSLGDKKLIITYSAPNNTTSLNQLLLVKDLLSLLGSRIEPLYLPVKAEYPSRIYSYSDTFIQTEPNQRQFALYINPNSVISYGFDADSSIEVINNVFGYFYPLTLKEDLIPIASVNAEIYDDKLVTTGYWKMNSGETKITLPTVVGSGYRIFIDWISEAPSENVPTSLYIPDIRMGPNTYDYMGIRLFLDGTSSNKKRTRSIVGVATKDNLEIVLQSDFPRLTEVTTSFIPKTPRLLSISGVLVSIAETTSSRVESQFTGEYQYYRISDAIPARTISNVRYGPIASPSQNYCGPSCSSTEYVEDGPMVVAHEKENVSSFSVGYNRSTITLISDSSLVQGRCMVDEFERLPHDTTEFLRTLYPPTSFPSTNAGRNYDTFTKIVAPERGSPQKYSVLSDKSGISSRFGGGRSLLQYAIGDNESKYDPKFVKRRERDPWEMPGLDDKARQRIIEEYIRDFIMDGIKNGPMPKFSGIIEGKTYSDVGIGGGMPDIMKDTGYDYIDTERFPSGYPGDLFGYSIALYDNKLIVGAPFAGFKGGSPKGWSGVGFSDIELSDNGGAGAVYVFEKTFRGEGLRGTFVPWQFIQRIRPDSINVGQDLTDSGVSQSSVYLGSNPYSSSFLTTQSTVTDQFGYSVDIDSDIVIVGAPGHDFENNTVNGTGQFIRKSFNPEFHIPSRSVTNLGSSGVRNSLSGSGVSVLNNGAIFAFENSIVDWSTKKQEWVLIEKILPQGSGRRSQNQNENELFGRAISIDRTFRSDCDYVIVGGNESHKLSDSGNLPLNNAGSVSLCDIMLRSQAPALPNSGTYFDAKIFGEIDANRQPAVRLIVQNNNDNEKKYYATGIVYADSLGQIFVEISGQDPVNKGFIAHRPYVVAIDGRYAFGNPASGGLALNINGKRDSDGNLNIFSNVPDSSIVYNSVGLYNGAILDFAQNSGLSLYTDCPNPTQISESGLILFAASGIGNNTESVNLTIRGF